MNFFRVPSRRHGLVVGSYLAVMAVTAALGVGGSEILTAVRAYVGGESLWSKEQKAAVRHLERYGHLRDPADYLRFEQALAVPLGDRRAREELSRAQPDLAVARAGLLAGGNHPDDVAGMIWLFRTFKDLGAIADAIAIWTEADGAIDELRSLGLRVREHVVAGEGEGPELRTLMQQLGPLEDRLNQLGVRFGNKLGEASRLSSHVVMITTLVLSGLLAAAGLVLIARMLRQQVDGERALREGNERWGLAADAAGIGVFDWDVGRGRVAFDARAAALAGVGSEETEAEARRLTGAPVHPDDTDRLRTALHLAIDRAEPVAVRYRIDTPEGTVRHVELRARVRANGRLTRMIGILRDVSQDTRAEQLRLDKEAAERANRAKGEFLSRVSHELRTPLNAVLGFSQLMQMDPNDTLTTGQAERVRHVIDSGRHLLELINDMLDVTSIDNGAVVLAPTGVPMVALLAQCRARLAELAAEHGVRLLSDLPMPELQVHADPRRAEQVLMHLISNAIKYNRPDGEVRLSLSRDGEEAVVSVSDTGAGMDAAQLAQLFQPFNRLGAEYSKEPGSGLGLVVTKQLVTLMGGSMSVTSRPGEGSTFVVRLPLAATQAAA